MKTLYFAILIVFSFSCKKSNLSNEDLLSKNRVDATIVLSSGAIIRINATGPKAVMGCGLIGGGTYVDGTNDTKSAIYNNIIGFCIVSPGTYSFSCQYRTDVSSQSAPIYENLGVSNPGSITFTTFTDHYAEGSFNAVCKYGTDSVTVNGTFSGYYQ